LINGDKQQFKKDQIKTIVKKILYNIHNKCIKSESLIMVLKNQDMIAVSILKNNHPYFLIKKKQNSI